VDGKILLQSPPVYQNGFDRLAVRILNNVKCDAMIALQQTVEMSDIKQGKYSLGGINKTVHIAAGLDVHSTMDGSGSRNMTKVQCMKVDRKVQSKDSQRTYKEGACTISMDMLTSDVDQSHTGFGDVQCFLYFVVIVTEGDIDSTTNTCSYLSWLEEWFFFFEMMYGHTGIRWEDHARNYKISKSILQRVFRQKLALVMIGKRKWPLYATCEEDIALRSGKWNDIFHPLRMKRIVMHDCTDVHLVKPSNPNLQRALYSQYYGGCVAKGGIRLQLCGWTVTFDLCTGGMDDTSYVKAIRIFESQEVFAKHDITLQHAFVNIFDHGYCLILDALACGGQLCVQPLYSRRRDGKFTTSHVLYLAEVAWIVCSGNEWSVRQVKQSWLIKRGLTYQPNWDLCILADMWLAWGFQVNFMYESVH